ncbi:pilus subunit protein [Terrihabitans soli]|uniref:Pilus subunit protein n=2 Tax=Terrihabitans soli TaxID=708113 RepID=A0A6S6QRQ9_9HYPH|nr:pilus subunit protein [Terrihabitans soli]
MANMIQLVKTFAKDESGATAIEYGLIAAMISVAVIGAVSFVGDELGNVFNSVGETLEGSIK